MLSSGLSLSNGVRYRFDFTDESLAQVPPGQQLISILNRTGDCERAFSTSIKSLARMLKAERILLIEFLDGEAVVTHFSSLNGEPLAAQKKSLDSTEGMHLILNFLTSQQDIISLSDEPTDSENWRYYFKLCAGKELTRHYLALIATQLSGASYGVLVIQTSNKNSLSDHDSEAILGLRDALAISIDRRNTVNHWRANIEEATALKNELVQYRAAEI